MQIDQHMTIYTASELKPLVLEEIAASPSPELDLSQVGECDSAGLQLLLLARREAAVLNRTLRITGASAAVREVLDLVGFDCATIDCATAPSAQGVLN